MCNLCAALLALATSRSPRPGCAHGWPPALPATHHRRQTQSPARGPCCTSPGGPRGSGGRRTGRLSRRGTSNRDTGGSGRGPGGNIVRASSGTSICRVDSSRASSGNGIYGVNSCGAGRSDARNSGTRSRVGGSSSSSTAGDDTTCSRTDIPVGIQRSHKQRNTHWRCRRRRQ